MNILRYDSSHYSFRKQWYISITIFKQEPIKKEYVEMVRQIVESEAKNDYIAISYRLEIIEDKDEGGFLASYLDLPGCITCG